jgi:hypothetical protein
LTPTQSRTPHPPGFPTSHHAFLIATIHLHDPGSGDLVDLELPDGARLRCIVTPDALRLGPGLAGRWRTTLHFRTRADGMIHQPVRLYRLRPAVPEKTDTLWSAAGKVTHLDVAAGLVGVRVYPDHARVEPFAIAARASSAMLSSVAGASFLHLRGALLGPQLVAHHIEAVSLGIHERWRGWPGSQEGELEVKYER